MFQDKEPLRSILLRDIQKVHECLVKSGWVKNKSRTQSLFLFHCICLSESLLGARWSDFIRSLTLVWPVLFVCTIVTKTMRQYFYYTNTNLYCFDASKMRTVSLFQTAVRSTVWRACLSIIFFFLWQNNIYAWQLSPLKWACCMNGNLNLLECPAFVLDDVRWAHSVGVCRLRIFWMLTLYSLIKARFNINLLFIFTVATCDSLLRLVRGTWLKCKAKLVLRCSNWLYDLSTK